MEESDIRRGYSRTNQKRSVISSITDVVKSIYLEYGGSLLPIFGVLFGELLQARHIVQRMKNVEHRAIGKAHLNGYALPG